MARLSDMIEGVAEKMHLVHLSQKMLLRLNVI